MYFCSMTKDEKRLVVIGGGAAGFFAAINIAKQLPAYEVIILEKNKQLLTKVKVSGGGRCNVTHACFDPKELSTFYPRGEKELLGPFHHFATGDTIAWFEEKGIELKMEADGRMFPDTDSSQTIIDCFLQEAEKYGVKIWNKVEVTALEPNSSNWTVELRNAQSIVAAVVIVATGGSSKASGYDFLRTTKHRLIPTVPSLFTFNLPKHASNKLMGLSYEVNIRLTDTAYEENGPLLFTHWGMSGPAILKLSSKAANWLNGKNYQFEFEVEWMNSAMEFMVENRKEKASSSVLKAKPTDMPQRLWQYLLDRAEIKPASNWADLTKNQLQRLEQVLSADIYHANGKTTFKEEFVSCGGVDLKEVDFRTMESKIHPNLYFAGEVLNIDALTGGFNFQAAWTTAYLVASDVVKKLNKECE